MASFKPHDTVVVRERTLHGNNAVLTVGEVVAVSGDKVKVSLQNRDGVKEVHASQVELAQASGGVLPNVGNPREQPIKRMFRD